MTSPDWSLPAALGIDQPGELVALVGGGGKSSLLFALADALSGRVVMTTTTRMSAAQVASAPAVCMADDLSRLSGYLDEHGRCLVIGSIKGEKALGVDVDLPGQLLARPDVDYVLVEADGARMRPIKAPAEHEPAIPPETTLLIPVAGLDALESPLDEIAHRPERIRALLAEAQSDKAYLTVTDNLTPVGLAELLVNPQGGLKNVSPAARAIPFLNKVDVGDRIPKARLAAIEMLDISQAIDRVVLGAVTTTQPVREVWRRVGAVIPAAGESRRMGRNKLLLPWGNATVLEQTVRNVHDSHIADILVITGHDGETVRALPGLQGQTIIHNKDYQSGMLSSVQTAVRHAPEAWAAILTVLGDQPMVGPDIINLILTAYASHPGGLVVPRHDGRRGNPVLIDRRYFPELLALPADSAPRALLARHPEDITWVDIATEAILHDLDRPKDYERWRP